MIAWSSTFDGNTTDATSIGAGIFNLGLLYLGNTIVTGNMNVASKEDDVKDTNFSNFTYWDGNGVDHGTLIGVLNANPQNGMNVSLAPLGNYGGPRRRQ
jgi:hypothetical protein